MRSRIEALFRDVIGPLFEADGASIELVEVRERRVLVRLGGSYRGCPSAPYTMDGVLIPALRKTTGEDFKVEVVV